MMNLMRCESENDVMKKNNINNYLMNINETSKDDKK